MEQSSQHLNNVDPMHHDLYWQSPLGAQTATALLLQQILLQIFTFPMPSNAHHHNMLNNIKCNLSDHPPFTNLTAVLEVLPVLPITVRIAIWVVNNISSCL